jgi:hypothetical protein
MTNSISLIICAIIGIGILLVIIGATLPGVLSAFTPASTPAYEEPAVCFVCPLKKK